MWIIIHWYSSDNPFKFYMPIVCHNLLSFIITHREIWNYCYAHNTKYFNFILCHACVIRTQIHTPSHHFQIPHKQNKALGNTGFPRAWYMSDKSVVIISLVKALINSRKSWRFGGYNINRNWDFTNSKEFNNCYILLSNISQALESTKFIAGVLSLRLSLVLYHPIRVYELW